MATRSRLLRVGDAVRFDGRLHTVVALEGTAVRLVDEAASASVVLLPHLLMSDGFEVVTAASPRMTVPASGVLEGLPLKEVERAEWWQRHLVEVLTGRPAHLPDGPVKPEYDPQVKSLRQRELAKAAELASLGTAVSLTVLQDMRARFEREGILGLVDPRLRTVPDGTGRTDRRVVAALRQVVDGQTDKSTVSAQVLRRRMERLVEAEHGPVAVAGDVLPAPGRGHLRTAHPGLGPHPPFPGQTAGRHVRTAHHRQARARSWRSTRLHWMSWSFTRTARWTPSR
jgi:hypothetical protein